MLAPNRNEVLKVETISKYTIRKVTHIHVKYHYFDRTEMQHLLVPIWDETDLPDTPYINTKSPLWREIN